MEGGEPGDFRQLPCISGDGNAVQQVRLYGGSCRPVEGGVCGGAGGHQGIGGGVGCLCHPLHGGQFGGEEGGHDQDWGSSGVSMGGSVGLCGYVLDLAAKGMYYPNCKTGRPRYRRLRSREANRRRG